MYYKYNEHNHRELQRLIKPGDFLEVKNKRWKGVAQYPTGTRFLFHKFVECKNRNSNCSDCKGQMKLVCQDGTEIEKCWSFSGFIPLAIIGLFEPEIEFIEVEEMIL